MLNPTNPRNRAVDWEADIVNQFRNNKDSSEIIGDRDTPTGRSFYVARPIRIAQPDLPALPQHGRRRAEDDDRALRPGQRLRLDS